jgi:hypothetical protein
MSWSQHDANHAGEALFPHTRHHNVYDALKRPLSIRPGQRPITTRRNPHRRETAADGTVAAHCRDNRRHDRTDRRYYLFEPLPALRDRARDAIRRLLTGALPRAVGGGREKSGERARAVRGRLGQPYGQTPRYPDRDHIHREEDDQARIRAGTTNAQGRLSNGSPEACRMNAASASGLFLHIEQHRNIRDDPSLLIQALQDVLPIQPRFSR